MQTITISNKISMLNDRNILIEYSGAFTHNTQHGQGIVNIRKEKENDSITVGRGNLIKVSVVGNLSGTINNNHSVVLRKGIIYDVTNYSSIQCCIFSFTKLLLER